MLNTMSNLAKEFLEISKDRQIRLISHYDTDGITSAAIMTRTLKRLDKKFTLRIVKGLEKNIIEEELSRNKREILFFVDLASSSIDQLRSSSEPVFILDHHEIDGSKINEKIKIVNPHLFNEEEICSAGLSYLFAKAISEKNKDLANTAIIGMVGDRHETKLNKHYQLIINDSENLEIKKSLLIFSATRPLRKSLEYSTSFYIPGVTGSSKGVQELLRENGISGEKTLYELTDEEISKLITSILIRMVAKGDKTEILGNLYITKFYNRKEDVRELSVLINACSRLGFPEIALSFCLQNEKAKEQAQDIYTQYKQELIDALKNAEKLEKIQGRGFMIMNAKDQIKDTIIGTVTSILSSSLDYESGTILIGMAYNQDKIKVSARVAGRDGKNLKEVLEKTISITQMNAEVGGHHMAAGCLIKKEDEQKFVEELRKNLEIEVVKI
ncbi:DHHA1 domain protein [uncultured archaeon]|nr:DHHA1 domain protein [uncultured archaeon]